MSEAEQYPKFSLNNSVEAVHANIERNIRRPLPQAQPHDVQETPVALICGGPSLNDSAEQLQDRYRDGLKLISTNGSHDWLLDRGMHPSAHIMVDSRRSNVRFVRTPDLRCRYLIASQCHPKVFDALEGFQTWIWHAACGPTERALLDSHYFGRYYLTLGGSTVALRGLSLLRMLGFSHIEMYGFDSCCHRGEHHAYPQPEHDKCKQIALEIEGKTFTCEAWMHSQAKEFQGLAKMMGDELSLIVHGDGLIAHMIKTGYQLNEEK